MRRALAVTWPLAAGAAAALLVRLVQGPHGLNSRSLISLLVGAQVAAAAAALDGRVAGRLARTSLYVLGVALPVLVLILLARGSGLRAAVEIFAPLAGFLALGQGLGALSSGPPRWPVRPVSIAGLALVAAMLAAWAVGPAESPVAAALAFALFLAGIGLHALPLQTRGVVVAASAPLAFAAALWLFSTQLGAGLALSPWDLRFVAAALFLGGWSEARPP